MGQQLGCSVFEQGHMQGFLAREELVDGTDRDVGLAGDFCHCGFLETLLDKNLRRHRKDGHPSRLDCLIFLIAGSRHVLPRSCIHK